MPHYLNLTAYWQLMDQYFPIDEVLASVGHFYKQLKKAWLSGLCVEILHAAAEGSMSINLQSGDIYHPQH